MIAGTHPAAFRGIVARMLPLILTCLVLTSCAAESSKPVWTDAPAVDRIEPISIDGTPGVRLILPHYQIRSTLADPAELHRLGRIMETALQAYRRLAPELPISSRPMDCYIFATRAQWSAYTKAHSGPDAPIYLRVNRGGYTIGDVFVAYWIGDIATDSVAAHEGFHQFVARNCKGRLPPFLEEGLACLFEQPHRDEDGTPHFDPSWNLPRLNALRAAVDEDQMYPLDKLMRMHAGQVVGQRSARIEAFYAESWAFARFLLEADDGRYRPALRHLLLDAGDGKLFADNSIDSRDGPLWDPASAQPMVEHYLTMPLPEIETAFARFVRQITDG